MKIPFQLNGEPVVAETTYSMRLLDVVRNEFGLTGTKEGCSEGECGACLVFLDNKLVNSCMVPMSHVVGKKVETIEGFAKSERYQVIEQAFQNHGAVQCGFCIPGMIMAVENLLRTQTVFTEEIIKESMSGNICRCTGYQLIYDAIKTVIQEVVE